MARIVISFKDKSEKDMQLYDEIVKKACGNNSAYVKSVFRDLYGMEDFTHKRVVEEELSTKPKEAKAIEHKESQLIKNYQIEEDDEIELELPEIPKEFINKNEEVKEEPKPITQSSTGGFDIKGFLQNGGSVPITK